MLSALSDFLIFCRVERRLADRTCDAYERDVRACLDFLRAQGIAALAQAWPSATAWYSSRSCSRAFAARS